MYQGIRTGGPRTGRTIAEDMGTSLTGFEGQIAMLPNGMPDCPGMVGVSGQYADISELRGGPALPRQNLAVPFQTR